MYKSDGRMMGYAFLCIHKFCLTAPRKLLDAQFLNQQYHSYKEIQTIPE